MKSNYIVLIIILLTIIINVSNAKEISWVKIGLNSKKITSITENIDNAIYVAADLQLYKYNVEDNAFKLIGELPDTALTLKVDTFGRIYAFMSTLYGWYSSIDSGLTWKLIDGAAKNTFIGKNGTLYTEAAGWYKSTDVGITWKSFTLGGTAFHSMSESSEGNIYVATGYYMYSRTGGFQLISAGLITSTNNGDTWSKIAGEGVYEYVSAGHQGLYIASYYTVPVSGGNRTDGLYLYNPINSSKINLTQLQSIGYSEITYDSKNIIYVRNKQGIYQSNDGLMWQLSNNGLNDLSLNCVFIDNRDFIYVGSNSGIYRSAEKVTTVSTNYQYLPNEFTLNQNYPNPFNPTTIIEYFVPRSSFVSLRLYDVLGREVMVIDEGRRDVGTYTIKLNANNLKSGAYYYHLIAPGVQQTKKLILIK